MDLKRLDLLLEDVRKSLVADILLVNPEISKEWPGGDKYNWFYVSPYFAQYSAGGGEGEDYEFLGLPGKPSSRSDEWTSQEVHRLFINYVDKSLGGIEYEKSDYGWPEGEGFNVTGESAAQYGIVGAVVKDIKPFMVDGQVLRSSKGRPLEVGDMIVGIGYSNKRDETIDGDKINWRSRSSFVPKKLVRDQFGQFTRDDISDNPDYQKIIDAQKRVFKHNLNQYVTAKVAAIPVYVIPNEVFDFTVRTLRNRDIPYALYEIPPSMFNGAIREKALHGGVHEFDLSKYGQAGSVPGEVEDAYRSELERVSSVFGDIYSMCGDLDKDLIRYLSAWFTPGVQTYIADRILSFKSIDMDEISHEFFGLLFTAALLGVNSYTGGYKNNAIARVDMPGVDAEMVDKFGDKMVLSIIGQVVWAQSRVANMLGKNRIGGKILPKEFGMFDIENRHVRNDVVAQFLSRVSNYYGIAFDVGEAGSDAAKKKLFDSIDNNLFGFARRIIGSYEGAKRTHRGKTTHTIRDLDTYMKQLEDNPVEDGFINKGSVIKEEEYKPDWLRVDGTTDTEHIRFKIPKIANDIKTYVAKMSRTLLKNKPDWLQLEINSLDNEEIRKVYTVANVYEKSPADIVGFKVGDIVQSPVIKPGDVVVQRRGEPVDLHIPEPGGILHRGGRPVMIPKSVKFDPIRSEEGVIYKDFGIEIIASGEDRDWVGTSNDTGPHIKRVTGGTYESDNRIGKTYISFYAEVVQPGVQHGIRGGFGVNRKEAAKQAASKRDPDSDQEYLLYIEKLWDQYEEALEASGLELDTGDYRDEAPDVTYEIIKNKVRDESELYNIMVQSPKSIYKGSVGGRATKEKNRREHIKRFYAYVDKLKQDFIRFDQRFGGQYFNFLVGPDDIDRVLVNFINNIGVSEALSQSDDDVDYQDWPDFGMRTLEDFEKLTNEAMVRVLNSMDRYLSTEVGRQQYLWTPLLSEDFGSGFDNDISRLMAVKNALTMCKAFLPSCHGVYRAFLKKKGFSDSHIVEVLSKYKVNSILEDEDDDNVEFCLKVDKILSDYMSIREGLVKSFRRGDLQFANLLPASTIIDENGYIAPNSPIDISKHISDAKPGYIVNPNIWWTYANI